MKQEYSIKGIEKIIQTAGREKLARYYGVDENADFETIITEDFKKHKIPNGLEVALYFSITPDEYNKIHEEGNRIPTEQDAASEVFRQDERKRAMFGFSYMREVKRFDENRKMVSGSDGNILYFFVDQPVQEETIGDYLYRPQYFMGGVHYYGLIMGHKFFEEHEDELKRGKPDRSKKEALESYLENFMNEFENVEYRDGHGPRGEYEETDEIREEKAENERIILELTGKSSINELSLQDFLDLKRRLEQEEKELQKQFEEQFTQRDTEE